MKFFSFLRIFNIRRPDSIEDGVNQSVAKHEAVLNKLEKYDRGEIQKPQNLAKYSSVREYLRDIQDGSRNKASRWRTTSSV